MRKPVVTIVGRPNVGKSTLFNRIIQKREAIVDDFSGVTRDRKYSDADWSGVEFTLIDTGGYFPNVDDKIGKEVLRQVEISIDEADVVVFLTDGRDGLTAMDEEIAQFFIRIDKPVLLAVNKLDKQKLDLNLHEFHALGLGEPRPIAAETGRNVGDLLDDILACISDDLKRPPRDLDIEEEDVLHLAIIGKPNVGKSSFVNAILGEDKHIVTDIPGTTRDAIDTKIRHQKEDLVLVDTAGLRRKSRVVDHIEYYSTIRTLETIRRCHVAIVLIDVEEGLTDQDKRIINEVLRFKKGLVFAANKWDLIEKDAGTAKEFERELRDELIFLKHYPTMFISALSGQRVFKVLDEARKVYQTRRERVSTSQLNNFLQEIVRRYQPPSMDRKEVKINYMTQVKYGPPVFALFANFPDSIKKNYRQYIENQFRERFPYRGVPLTFVYKKK